MATAKKRVLKNGEISYYIRAYHGYDANGRPKEHSMTWKPSPKMTQKAIEKELNYQMAEFDKKVKKGNCFDSNITFKEYSEIWLSEYKANYAPKTFQRYCSLLDVINIDIGRTKLIDLNSHDIQKFYDGLREKGANTKSSHATSKPLFRTVIDENNLSKSKIAEAANIGVTTVRKAYHPGEHISIKSAEAISKALNMSTKKLFDIHQSDNCYSDKTILHCHRLINVILKQAVMDDIISRNVASGERMHAPKSKPKEAAFLDEEQVTNVIALLEKEPIKWKTAILLLIYSGIRRGELMGLEWKDIDFTNKLIKISRTSQYVSKLGIITKDTKNTTSKRTILLPDNAFKLLKEYREHCKSYKTQVKDYWHNKITITYANGEQKIIDNDRLFTTDDGNPMNPDSLTDYVNKFVHKHNLPKFTVHSLRHTNASILIANGVNIATVAKRLGHANSTTTAKIYTHALQSVDAKASAILADKLDPIHHE
jgi:integrase